MKAFPQKYPKNPLYPCGELNPVETGMDLRDYFAAKAMQSFVNDPKFGMEHVNDSVISAYVIADAMMKARETK